MTTPPPAAGALVTVVGIDAAGRPAHPGLAEALAGAGLVVGAARHLAAVPLPPGCATVALGPLTPALDRLRAAVAAGTPAIVLASGDPGFFGIVRRLRAAGLPLRVLPAVSSVAAVFARAGLPWDGAAVVTAHGRDLRPALNACRALPAVAVLTAPGAGATELGAGLVGWPRRLLVGEHLGTPDERVTWTTPEEAAGRAWADPHVLLSLTDPPARDPLPGPAAAALRTGEAGVPVFGAMRADNQPAAAPTGGWALPESAYAHRASMITKAEVRALVVARLRPRLGRLIWDVGAGSGSVGIECALLGAAVVAVERDPAAPVRANAARHRVDVRVVTGGAPAVLAGLPAPDAVFVGGGGTDVLAAVAARHPERVVVTLAALDRVAPAVHLLRAAGYAVEGSQLAAARLADLPGGSIRLAATNPVVVLTGERP
ncbi:precorrin-6y C5,15-methyltransferase (decarboxylating) subunit CbiE [Micromonospora sp. 4G57]|uniref:Precorrin-6y C5,15-methyltransferase (Decarboxylating) subunit CbiE n=1 Tax=Micromonospora sicca TaxID=2202420 RepID=A0ABU5JI32_9ACTN|nr:MULTISPECIES: precorrin-6y C5,15-methyltransferase (decarboxylating) subunit CbiE [unclassified Micromonospora]MDZ5442142.1 precorrin-6y C5,15-methyltransferase (decarboxylating) subunit CbiE [Micromonospora sp. 4G57]MDZ5492089.1 precorrin-6y C5,15-methyltransferase (decarboxylating) subunit CbiE [Micromonospora sp. 4G53]